MKLTMIFALLFAAVSAKAQTKSQTQAEFQSQDVSRAKVSCSIVAPKDPVQSPYAFDDLLMETKFENISPEGQTRYFLISQDHKTITEISGDELNRRREAKDFANYEGGTSLSIEIYSQTLNQPVAMIVYRDINVQVPKGLSGGSLLVGGVGPVGFFGAPIGKNISIGCSLAKP